MRRPLEVYERPHCACCGQLFTWGMLVEKREERNLRFCSQNCVEVFDTYILPTYGQGILDTFDKSVFEPGK